MCLRIEVDHPECVLGKGEAYGFEWVVVHNQLGFRCGYVRIPPGHPWHALHYDDIPVECHGGLTFGEMDKPCEKPGPDDAYWIGFDCGHCDDARDPDLPSEYPLTVYSFSNGVIRTQEYVEQECKDIAEQVAVALFVGVPRPQASKPWDYKVDWEKLRKDLEDFKAAVQCYDEEGRNQ